MKTTKAMAAALLAALPLGAAAQVKVNGKVTDENGRPIAGVNIRVDNSIAGGTTNGKGEYSIGGLAEGRHTLNFSNIGYVPEKITTDGTATTYDIRMTESYNRLQQVVVTGTGTHRRMADSPVPVAVITAKDIAESNAATLEEALTKLSPSISTFTNGMGTTMSLNGINEDYILILENGRRLSGDDRYTRTNLANVKRIEILNGAASALYGSEAIGGVINIITDDSRNTVDVASRTYVSSHGRFTENADADINAGIFSSHTSYKRHQADNWQNNGTDEDGLPTGKPTSIGFYQDHISQRFELRPTDRLSVSLFGSWFDSETRRPEDAKYYSKGKLKDAYSYDLRHETFNYGTAMRYIISPKAYVEAEFFSDNYTSSYKYFRKSGGNMPGDEVTRKKTHYYNGNVKGIFKLGSHNKLSVGMEYVNDQLKSESDNIAFENMYTMALFAQDEIRIARGLQAVLGLRYIYNENFKNYATPNVAVMYRLGGLNVRAAYAAGFRTPTLSQLYATDISKTQSRFTVGNPGLKAEKSNFYSLNAEYTYRRLSLSVTGFINDIRDMINYRTLTDAELTAMGLTEEMNEYDEIRQRDNVDKATTKGVSVSASWNAGLGFSLGAGYTFLDTEAKQLQDDGTYEVTPIDKSIRHIGNFRGAWEHSWGIYRLNVSLLGRIQGKRYSQTYGYAPKCQQWDLNTRHTISLKNLILEPAFGIENIFDDTDDRPWNNNFSTLSPGRAFYVSLSVRFKS